jgi:hypothetical protein
VNDLVAAKHVEEVGHLLRRDIALEPRAGEDARDLRDEPRADDPLEALARPHALTPLRLALDAAVAEGLLAGDPAEQVVLPRRRAGRAWSTRERRFLTRAELVRLLDEVPPKWRPLFELLAATGLWISAQRAVGYPGFTGSAPGGQPWPCLLSEWSVLDPTRTPRKRSEETFMNARRLVNIVLAALAAVSVVTTSSAAADARPPRIVAAVMQDRDGDGRADAVRLTYSERVRRARDRDGRYPFRVAGYRVRSVGAAKRRSCGPRACT